VPPCKAYARGGEAPAATLPLEPKRRWVAIKAGALVSTIDGGRIWRDRVTGGSKDTHELVSPWSASWRPGRFLAQADNVLIFSAPGVGNTHLAIAQRPSVFPVGRTPL
jgi:hypothetical protein